MPAARRHVKHLKRTLLGDTSYDDLLKLVQGNGPEAERKEDLTRGNACRFFGMPSPPGQGEIEGFVSCMSGPPVDGWRES